MDRIRRAAALNLWFRVGSCCIVCLVLWAVRYVYSDAFQSLMVNLIGEIIDMRFEEGRFPWYTWVACWSILCVSCCVGAQRMAAWPPARLGAISLCAAVLALYIFLSLPRWRAGGCEMWYPWISHPEYRNPDDPRHSWYTNYCERYFSGVTVDMSNITISAQQLAERQAKVKVIEDISGSDQYMSAIPMILHQQAAARSAVPLQYSRLVSTCHEMAPGFAHVFWEDADFEPFLKTHYPRLWPAFAALPTVIQKIDTIRYAILHHYGGVYLDADVICNAPLSDWLTRFGRNYSVFMEPIHMIATGPRDPIWENLMNQVIGDSAFHTAGAEVIESSVSARKDVLVDRSETLFRPQYLEMSGVSTWRVKWRKTQALEVITTTGYMFVVVSALTGAAALGVASRWRGSSQRPNAPSDGSWNL